VPTWNYLSAEIEGPVRRLGRDRTIALLDDLAAHFEAGLAPKQPWTRAQLSPERFEVLLGGIVGFEMHVERLEGVTKLSQNKTSEQVARAAGELARRPEEGAHAVAGLMANVAARGPDSAVE
jgi:transcriptional regulator